MFPKKSGLTCILFLLCLHIFGQQEIPDVAFSRFVKRELIGFRNQPFLRKAIQSFEKQEYDSVLTYTTKSLQMDMKNSICGDYIHFLRGVSFKQKKIFKQAQKEFNRITPRLEYQEIIKYNHGQILLEMLDFQKSLQIFLDLEKQKRAFKFIKEGGLHNNIGVCYLHLKEYDFSEKYLVKAITFYKKNRDKSALIMSYINIANLNYEQYKDAVAINYFTKAYLLSKKISDFSLKRTCSKNMAVVEENRGDHHQALVYRKEFELWNDSLNNQNKIWDVAQFEKKFAVQQKQKEINVLALENRAKNAERNGLLASSVLLTGLILTGGYFYRQKIKSSKIIVLQKNELDQLNETKDKLFSIVSHDLRSSVYALKNSNQKLLKNLETKNYTDIDQLLQRNSNITNSSYNLLDNLLNWAQQQNNQLYFQKEFLQLHSIINQVEYNFKYLFLEKNIIFYNKVEKENLVFMDLDSLKIILRNFLDNALKYSPNGGAISMYCVPNEKNGYIQLVIEDTGLGMSQQRIHELLDDHKLLMKKDNKEIIGTGLGIQLCKTMLKKNGGDLFAIESEEGEGTKIILLLPKVNRDESN